MQARQTQALSFDDCSCYGNETRRAQRKFRKMSQSRTIVLGGARSGKSAFAEGLVNKLGKAKVYVATAQAFDTEMNDRIKSHQIRRDSSWTTVEAPLDIESALRNVAPDTVVLLDCATLWLSNHLLAGSNLDIVCDQLVAAISECIGAVVVVSNEVGFGIVPENAMARQFRDAQGKLNQQLAATSDLAVLVVAGLPVVLKGKLPQGPS